jgi:hypothetical protein
MWISDPDAFPHKWGKRHGRDKSDPYVEICGFHF